MNKNLSSSDTTKLRMKYDAAGNRMVKKDVKQKTKEIYVCDAQGNVMAVYEIRKDSLYLSELYMYGSQRLGYLKENTLMGELRKNKFCATINTPLPFNPNNSPAKIFNSVPLPVIPAFGNLSAYTPIYFGKKRYELNDWLGNVRVVINDRKTPVNTGSVTVSYRPQVVSVSDYYSFGSEIAERSYDPVKPRYRFGFNTQERVSEIEKDHYTAKFWEYDTRVVLRWNTDPKTDAGWSLYAINQCNPILYSDPLGDTVRTDAEGAANTKMAIESILDKKPNPIGFDKERGILTYNDKIDISGYSDFQKDVLTRYKELITNKVDVNLKIVDVNEKIEDLKGESLNERGASGITKIKYVNDAIDKINVYVARNPVKSDGVTSERKEYAGVTNLHELGGHTYLYLTQPLLKTNDHNKLVEDFHKQINLNYKINGALWYKRSEVPLHKRVKE